MGWIKRNIAFVISGIVALALLGAAGYFIYAGFALNSKASSDLDEAYQQLQKLSQSPEQPGNDKIDNIKAAKEQEQQLRQWIAEASAYFNPVPPIPEGEVTSKTYATALGTTIYQLTQEAKDDSVMLPPQYYFSFQVQSSKLTISSGLGPLAQQLGEVKAIAEILFAARVNSLDGIQRVQVSDDDVSGGLQSDYTEMTPITNDLAIITPYVVTFRSFTPELAKVLAGFANSSNMFIVKTLSVQPASGAAAADNANPAMPGMPAIPGFRGGPGMPAIPGAAGYGGAPGYPRPGYPGTPVQTTGRGGLQTVLKEQLLHFTLQVDIVKLRHRN
jgi:hypothetical protein